MSDLEHKKQFTRSNPTGRSFNLISAGVLLLLAALSAYVSARLILGTDLNGYIGNTFVPLRTATLLAVVAVGAAVAAVASLLGNSHPRAKARSVRPEELDIFNVRSNSKVA